MPSSAKKQSATTQETSKLVQDLPISPYSQPIMAVPFFFFSLESLVALYCFRTHGTSDWMLNMMFAHLLAINSVHTGLTHFLAPFAKYYDAMIFLPGPGRWLRLTGFFFLLGGFAVAFSKTQVYGAFLLFATFLSFIPFYMYCLFSVAPRNAIFKGSLLRVAARLLFQACFLVWAWWFTTPPLPFPF